MTHFQTQLRLVAILCGGKGTRLHAHEAPVPKPLVEIGGRPILWHVIRLYAEQGVREVVLLTGFKARHIGEWADSEEWPEGVRVECVDTGEDTPTGGRLHLAADRLRESGESFAVTYADGLADLDLGALERFHRAHGRAATVTVVRPELPFGVVELGPDGAVHGFHEKPRAEHWMNGGFFVLEPRALDEVDAGAVLERGPLERLATAGELRGFRHGGFWACMDTYKDALRLNELWERGDAPWLVPALRP